MDLAIHCRYRAEFFIIYAAFLFYRMCKAIVKNCNRTILCVTFGKSLEYKASNIRIIVLAYKHIAVYLQKNSLIPMKLQLYIQFYLYIRNAYEK